MAIDIDRGRVVKKDPASSFVTGISLNVGAVAIMTIPGDETRHGVANRNASEDAFAMSCASGSPPCSRFLLSSRY